MGIPKQALPVVDGEVVSHACHEDGVESRVFERECIGACLDDMADSRDAAVGF